MIRLGQRAWNNVLIFVMLFMIYIFSVSNRFLGEPNTEQEAVELLPPFSVIMSLDFGSASIERIGQDWRVNGQPSESTEQLVTKLNAWEALYVIAIDTPEKIEGNPFVVTMQIAGEERKRVYQVYTDENGLFLQWQGHFYDIPNRRFDELLPSLN